MTYLRDGQTVFRGAIGHNDDTEPEWPEWYTDLKAADQNRQAQLEAMMEGEFAPEEVLSQPADQTCRIVFLGEGCEMVLEATPQTLVDKGAWLYTKAVVTMIEQDIMAIRFYVEFMNGEQIDICGMLDFGIASLHFATYLSIIEKYGATSNEIRHALWNADINRIRRFLTNLLQRSTP